MVVIKTFIFGCFGVHFDPLYASSCIHMYLASCDLQTSIKIHLKGILDFEILGYYYRNIPLSFFCHLVQ
jgi:hypothetical protein